MKLPWFAIQTEGNYFAIVLVPGLFFGLKPAETYCHSVITSKWLKTQVCPAGRKHYNLNTNTEYWQFNV